MPSFSLMTNDRAGLVANSPVVVPLPISGMEAAAEPATVVKDTVASAPPVAVGSMTGRAGSGRCYARPGTGPRFRGRNDRLAVGAARSRRGMVG